MARRAASSPLPVVHRARVPGLVAVPDLVVAIAAIPVVELRDLRIRQAVFEEAKSAVLALDEARAAGGAESAYSATNGAMMAGYAFHAWLEHDGQRRDAVGHGGGGGTGRPAERGTASGGKLMRSRSTTSGSLHVRLDARDVFAQDSDREEDRARHQEGADDDRRQAELELIPEHELRDEIGEAHEERENADSRNPDIDARRIGMRECVMMPSIAMS